MRVKENAFTLYFMAYETNTLLDEIAHFLAESRMSPSGFGWAVAMDPRLVADLETGARELLPRNEKAVRNFINGWRLKAGTWSPPPRNKRRAA